MAEFERVLTDLDGDAMELQISGDTAETWRGKRCAWLDGSFALTPDHLREWAAAFIAAADCLDAEARESRI
jgi:hypothetical protein